MYWIISNSIISVKISGFFYLHSLKNWNIRAIVIMYVKLSFKISKSSNNPTWRILWLRDEHLEHFPKLWQLNETLQAADGWHKLVAHWQNCFHEDFSERIQANCSPVSKKRMNQFVMNGQKPLELKINTIFLYY